MHRKYRYLTTSDKMILLGRSLFDISNPFGDLKARVEDLNKTLSELSRNVEKIPNGDLAQVIESYRANVGYLSSYLTNVGGYFVHAQKDVQEHLTAEQNQQLSLFDIDAKRTTSSNTIGSIQ